jgi:uncharacterized protein (DUF2062 family)
MRRKLWRSVLRLRRKLRMRKIFKRSIKLGKPPTLKLSSTRRELKIRVMP